MNADLRPAANSGLEYRVPAREHHLDDFSRLQRVTRKKLLRPRLPLTPREADVGFPHATAAYALPAEPPVATGTIAFDEGTGWSVRVRYSYSFVRVERRVKVVAWPVRQWLDRTALALVATYKPT